MQHLVLLVQALDPVPSDNNVKAGWGAFGVFALLILAVAFLCWSFVKQMRKVKDAAEAGVYDEGDEAGTPGAHVSERNQEQSGS
jgi:cbb3-type cytochrome oxidase subunit 3